MGIKLINKLAYYFSIIFLLNGFVSPVRSSSALAAWALRSNGVLELRTKPNSKLKAYFQKANRNFGDRFWVDFKGELIKPRVIKGNGPVKEIRLGKPNNGQTRLVVEFNKDKSINPYNLELIGISENKWKIKLASFQKNSFKAISEGLVSNSSPQISKKLNLGSIKGINLNSSSLPNVRRNKFYVVIDPGHGGPDTGAIGISGLRETDVVLDVSKTVTRLLSEKGVNVRMTRTKEIDLDLAPRVAIANRTGADIFVSIHANASRGKKRDINGLETFYYSGWRGRLLAQKIQNQILKVSPGSPDRGVRRGRYFVIRKTNMPAVLVEIGFVTGRLDARRLEKSIHRKRVAYAIAKGILEYLQRVG
tara:strand:+ start:6114 stop:7202 length:1089 start_codon:yes stop_codon:yes gene_type:complete